MRTRAPRRSLVAPGESPNAPMPPRSRTESVAVDVTCLIQGQDELVSSRSSGRMSRRTPRTCRRLSELARKPSLAGNLAGFLFALGVSYNRNHVSPIHSRLVHGRAIHARVRICRICLPSRRMAIYHDCIVHDIVADLAHSDCCPKAKSHRRLDVNLPRSCGIAICFAITIARQSQRRLTNKTPCLKLAFIVC